MHLPRGQPAHQLPQSGQPDRTVPGGSLSFKAARGGKRAEQRAPPALPALAAPCINESVQIGKNMWLNKGVYYVLHFGETYNPLEQLYGL